MSANNTEETEELIVKLLKKLERKGRNIPSFLWKLMDEFEDEQFDEKNDENKSNMNKQKITLLFSRTASKVCKIGHKLKSNSRKHLSIEPCIMCGHRNNSNIQNKSKPEILNFLSQYNMHKIPFGPHQDQKPSMKAWSKKWPLHTAAITGDIAEIKQLCKNKNINIDEKRTNYYDTTPITIAARYGQLESVIELIKNGANSTPPPDKSNITPFSYAVLHKHESIVAFYKEYIKYLYNFDIDDNTNLQCHSCYNYDLHFNKHLLNGTMTKYVYCINCTFENLEKLNVIQQENKIIERRIIKTLKENVSLSVDTLCQMKDVKALHSILKDIVISGEPYAYWLWLLDIDNFKVINSHLTHAVADTKIQALAQVLKNLEPNKHKQWSKSGYDGINQVWAFRQGGDEFALVVKCNRSNQKKKSLQKLYETLKDNIDKIKLENIVSMKHITVSIGVCSGHSIGNYEEMMQKADEMAEMVKMEGKNNIAIFQKGIYRKFADTY